jgi:hypothetical protein
MAGKEGGSTKLTVTKPVARSLSKLADYLERAPTCADSLPELHTTILRFRDTCMFTNCNTQMTNVPIFSAHDNFFARCDCVSRGHLRETYSRILLENAHY